MQDTRNNCGNGFGDRTGTVCIDTKRVLDSCRDRDCFEDVRVYLTAYGDEVIGCASNVRVRSAEIVGAYVGVDEVPFNNGFYKVTVRYYVKLDIEVCQGMGRSTVISGLSVLEKDVVLYGGCGNVTSFSSGADNSYCSYTNANVGVAEPIAVVEVVEPVVLGTRLKEKCGCDCCCDIPETVRGCIDGEIANNENGIALYVSFGIFSTVRLQRTAQILVTATDYCVPDKECTAATSNNDPCDLFMNMAFPVNRFNGGCQTAPVNTGNGSGGCGCKKN